MQTYLTRFPTDMFAELDRLRQQMDDAWRGFGSSADIRSTGRGAFPAINVGGTADTVEIVALAPGIDPKKIELSIEKGVLTISGERLADGSADGTAGGSSNGSADASSNGAADGPADSSTGGSRASVYARERFAGPFRRVISLPEDCDPERVEARYADGCLRVSIGKRESSKPRSIQIQ